MGFGQMSPTHIPFFTPQKLYVFNNSSWEVLYLPSVSEAVINTGVITSFVRGGGSICIIWASLLSSNVLLTMSKKNKSFPNADRYSIVPTIITVSHVSDPEVPSDEGRPSLPYFVCWGRDGIGPCAAWKGWAPVPNGSMEWWMFNMQYYFFWVFFFIVFDGTL